MQQELASKGGEDFQHFVNAIIELVFERERLKIGSSLPRRTGTVHVFRDLEGARTFRSEFRSPASGIYEVRHMSMAKWKSPFVAK